MRTGKPRSALSAIQKTNPSSTRSPTATSAGIDEEEHEPDVEYGRPIDWPVLSGVDPEDVSAQGYIAMDG
eukprot:9603513-Heterocapsa_arctica.AAC.1